MKSDKTGVRKAPLCNSPKEDIVVRWILWVFKSERNIGYSVELLCSVWEWGGGELCDWRTGTVVTL